MKVAVVGAGALGGVYGVRLATAGSVDVVFVVRTMRDRALTIESIHGHRRASLETPAFSLAIPADVDAIVVTVGTENLGAIEAALAASQAPIVVITPMLPKTWTRLRNAFGDRVHAALPNVVAYERHATADAPAMIRYWRLPTPTKIDEPRAGSTSLEAVHELVAALTRAGLRGQLDLGVHEENPATTIRFIPIAMVVALAGSTAALVEDEALLALATSACREGARLAERVGRAEVWSVFAPVLAAPWALRMWLAALARVSPEAHFYLEEHFGRKLVAQHRFMIEEMIELAREKGLPHDAFDELARRFAERAKAG